jgi:hypothetical protein
VEIVAVEGDDGYQPSSDGSLEQLNETVWRYYAFNEAPTETCPKFVTVWIAVLYQGIELERRSVLVAPVHKFLTTGPNADFNKDYVYISLKYGPVLATTGGVFWQRNYKPRSLCSLRPRTPAAVCLCVYKHRHWEWRIWHEYVQWLGESGSQHHRA